MPRSKDERKYSHARELLKSSLSINDIREQLITLYGSAISPNTLLEWKQKIAPKKKGFSLFPKKNIVDSAADLSQLDIYNLMMKDIDRKLENHILLIFNKLEMQEKSHTRDIITEIKNLGKNTEETNFFQHFTTIKNDILDFLTRRSITFEAIVQGLELSPELTKLALMDLENSSQLFVKKNNQGEVTYHKIPKDYQDPLQDPKIKLEIEEIKDVLKDVLLKEQYKRISERKDEQIICVALEQLTNEWKNPHDRKKMEF